MLDETYDCIELSWFVADKIKISFIAHGKLQAEYANLMLCELQTLPVKQLLFNSIVKWTYNL